MIMKRLFLLVFVFAMMFAVSPLFAQEQPEQPEQPKEEEPGEDEGDTVKWEADVETAFKKAKEKNTMIMMYFYIQNSDMCSEFEEKSINQAEVIKLSEKFVCVKIEKNKEKETAKRFGIGTAPNVLFATADRKRLGHVRECLGPEPFAKKVKEIYESIEIEKKTREILRKDPENLEANLKLAKVYIIREATELAEHCLNKVVDGDARNKKGLLIEAAFRLGYLQAQGGTYKAARDNFKKVRKYDVLDEKGYGDDMLIAEAEMCMNERNSDEALKKLRLFTGKFAKSEFMHRALFLMGHAYYQKNEIANVIKAWEELVEKFPSTGEADRAKYMIPQLKKMLDGQKK
jgi:tetratricopeptide (TPR) repeat protein